MFITLLENNKKATIMIYKRLLAFLLSFALIFSSTSALANTSIGGWTALDTITAGATNTINAVKGAGATGMRSAVSVAPSAVKVGKFLIKGGGSAALLLAVPQLIGDGVDWVLDPANNRIKYTAPSSDNTGVSSQYLYANAASFSGSSVTDPDLTNFCHKYIANFNSSLGVEATFSRVEGSGSGGQCIAQLNGSDLPLGTHYILNPAYDTNAPANQEKSIPIDTVAAKVIANAEAGHAPSQEAVKATALEGFAAGEHDAALDAAAVPDTGVENPTDPADPVDPAKPVDLSPITAAINALKAILSGILSAITSLTDWFKGEPEANKPEDNKIDIPEVPLPDIDSSVSFGGSCPDDLGADFNLYGTNFNFVLMPFSKLCPLLSTFIKPTLILLGSFMAVAIVGGRKDA